MKPLISHLDAIKQLRFDHSRQFAANDFSRMPALDTKIRQAWEAYDRAREAAFVANRCFACNYAKPNKKFTVTYPDRTPMLFCSDNCRLTFGVSLGLT